jgi:hypothetical protein
MIVTLFVVSILCTNAGCLLHCACACCAFSSDIWRDTYILLMTIWVFEHSVCSMFVVHVIFHCAGSCVCLPRCTLPVISDDALCSWAVGDVDVTTCSSFHVVSWVWCSPCTTRLCCTCGTGVCSAECLYTGYYEFCLVRAFIATPRLSSFLLHIVLGCAIGWPFSSLMIYAYNICSVDVLYVFCGGYCTCCSGTTFSDVFMTLRGVFLLLRAICSEWCSDDILANCNCTKWAHYHCDAYLMRALFWCIIAFWCLLFHCLGIFLCIQCSDDHCS